jgi:hypothetical protein
MATSLESFLPSELKTGLDLRHAEGCARLVHLATPWLQRITGPALRDRLLAELSLTSRCTVEELEMLCELDPL